MPDTPSTAPLLSLDQTADLLQVSTRTLRRAIADQELAAHKVGRQWRIARKDLEAYLRRHRKGDAHAVL
ncbi:helix-turn-helix domain-containing protein [Sedimentimonas flavescens]|uniref:Helix-turn-helix domain-containing protein n=1 Tax=Sedimentimonas flavescens TaxID=2851012 RepID=A0ABT3A3D7_9RHOB|nr:helix-turn-helix domain-containing protein [Sedimentimonas flavescens]MCV2880367.1 helix-turn-helix domain-containing protein [Sedimentimonas flavescens]